MSHAESSTAAVRKAKAVPNGTGPDYELPWYALEQQHTQLTGVLT